MKTVIVTVTFEGLEGAESFDREMRDQDGALLMVNAKEAARKMGEQGFWATPTRFIPAHRVIEVAIEPRDY